MNLTEIDVPPEWCCHVFSPIRPNCKLKNMTLKSSIAEDVHPRLHYPFACGLKLCTEQLCGLLVILGPIIVRNSHSEPRFALVFTLWDQSKYIGIAPSIHAKHECTTFVQSCWFSGCHLSASLQGTKMDGFQKRLHR